MSIIFSTAGMAQKKVVSKKNPNTPVFINTKSGKHIPVPLLKPVPADSRIQTRTPKKKVMMRNTSVSKGNKFTKVTRRVPIRTQGKSNQRGGATFKDIDIYYPQSKIEVNYSSFQRKRRKDSYASITLSNQGMVDDFTSTYPDCDEVGTLIINAPNINNLAALNNISGIGVLIIKNTILTDLSDMESLTSISDSLILENNASLTRIGLSNVSVLGGLK